MIVLGGGPVGCELGQAFARLGVKVTILQSGARLLAKEDADVAGLVRRRLEAEDVRVITAAKATRVTREGGLYRVRLEAEDKVEEIEPEAMLVAAGRAPNLEGLDLEKAGVAFDKKGVRLNEDQAKRQGTAYDVWVEPLEDLDRAIVESEEVGFARVLTAKGSDRILTKGRSQRRPIPWKWIGAGLVFLALFVAWRLLPVDERVLGLQHKVARMGVLGGVVFALVYVAAALLLVPGAVLTIAAGVVFGIVWGTLLVSASSTAAAAVAFLIARYVGVDAAGRRARGHGRGDGAAEPRRPSGAGQEPPGTQRMKPK